MQSVLDHVKRLSDEGLHGSVVELLDLLLPQELAGLGTSDVFQTPQHEFQAYFLYGNSLYYVKDWRKAEKMYNMALESRRQSAKVQSKSTKKSQSALSSEQSMEVEIRYQLHLCQKKLQQNQNAIKTLESIPIRQRTARVNMALGELYQKEKLNSQAIVSYKEILKENPLALKVISALLRLDVKATDIINIVTCSTVNLSQLDWLQTWIKAQASLYTAESSEAIGSFKKLISRPQLRDNSDLQAALAEAYYYNGDYKKAASLFKRVYSADPMCVRGMDVYAALLTKENLSKELELLANRMIPRCETGESRAEPWIVLAYFAFMNNRKESKALYFTQKACLLSNNSLESLLLKGKIMAEAKSQLEAITYFSEAYLIAPYRFEALQALTEAYLACESKRASALSMAQCAFKTFGQTPRTLTLYAKVTLNDEKAPNKRNAKTMLEKATKMDRQYLPAVYLYVQMLMDEKNYEKAVETLTKSLEYESNTKLHRLLGDCYSQLNESERALHHHNIANKLWLEVNYRGSNEAAQRLDSQTNASNTTRAHQQNASEPSLDLEHEEDRESDEMESESEVVWSDGDF